MTAVVVAWRGRGADDASEQTRPVARLSPRPAPAPAPPAPEPPPGCWRLLAVSINDYLYMEPVRDAPVPGRDAGIDVLAERLAESLRVPAGQSAVLSDRATRGQARAPLKTVVETTVADLLDGCRAQDRALLVFIGRVADAGGGSYLVPMDGEPARTETLIPLSWLYDRLAHCRARQKVLIMDVCRRDPARDPGLPVEGPMSPALATALGHPPDGVEVWSACGAGENSLETVRLSGPVAGVFLGELVEALLSPELSLPAGGAFPSGALATAVAERTRVRSGALIRAGAAQTPRLAGHPRKLEPPGDDRDAARPVVLAPGPPPAGAVADTDVVNGILRGLDALPAVAGPPAPNRAALPPFAAASLQEYAATAGSDALDPAVAKVVRLLRQPRFARPLEFSFPAGTDTARLKARALARQEEAAGLQAELDDVLADLRRAAGHDAPPRLHATSELLAARLTARATRLYEYNAALARLRQDALPKVTGAPAGWYLAPRPALAGGKEAERLAADARRAFAAVAAAHAGTPWEVYARRDAATFLGLEWVPVP